MGEGKRLQEVVYQNKVNHGFNVTDVSMEFCLLHGELAEAYEAYTHKSPELGEELADAAIYLLGLAEILHVDLEAEIRKKMVINERRRYEMVDGVLQRTEDGRD